MQRDLSLFFRPAGVAVIGASGTPKKLGHSVICNLIEQGYTGKIYPVNPKGGQIIGLPAYTTIADVPDPLDLAIIALPAKFAQSAVEACGQRGVKGVTIIAGGFREIGDEGRVIEDRIAEIAQHYNMMLLGPNCIGTIDTHTPLNATFITVNQPQPGNIALVSQSGAVAVSIVDWAKQYGMGFSRIVSLGNQAQMNQNDMLQEVARSTHTKVIAGYFEGIVDGEDFLKSVREVSRKVPVVAIKAGHSEGGSKAIASHTGSLAGAETAYNAAFEQTGVIRASTLEELLDWSRTMAWQPIPQGNRVAVLTNAGGLGVLVTDALETAGMRLAAISDTTKARLREYVPPPAIIENPVDLLAGPGPETYALCLAALLADDHVDAAVVMTAPVDWFSYAELARAIGETANAQQTKPVLTVLMGIDDPDTNAILHEHHIPNFPLPERAGGTLSAMWRRQQWLNNQQNQSPIHPFVYDRAAVQTALDNQSGWLPLDAVDQILHAYAIAIPPSQLTTSVEQAIEAASTMGYPVALKLVAEDLTHKADIGAVLLNIGTPELLKDAFNELWNKVESVQGVYVQKMVRGELEIIAGVVHDPTFGPLAMVGSGGSHVELLDDVAFALGALSEQQVDDMLNKTTTGRLLDGYRGKPPCDRQSANQIIRRLAQIAVDWPQIAEIEINPVIVMARGEGAVAVDARIRAI